MMNASDKANTVGYLAISSRTMVEGLMRRAARNGDAEMIGLCRADLNRRLGVVTEGK